MVDRLMITDVQISEVQTIFFHVRSTCQTYCSNAKLFCDFCAVKMYDLDFFDTHDQIRLGLVMVLSATFNNILVISLPSVLLVEKTTDLLQFTDQLYHIMLY